MPPPATPRLGEPHARLSIRPEGGSPPAGGSAAGAAVVDPAATVARAGARHIGAGAARSAGARAARSAVGGAARSDGREDCAGTAASAIRAAGAPAVRAAGAAARGAAVRAGAAGSRVSPVTAAAVVAAARGAAVRAGAGATAVTTAAAAVVAASRASAAPRVRIEVDEATAATTTGSGPGASSAAAGTTLRARSGRAGRAGRASRAGAARRTLAVTLHGPGSDAQGGGAAERVVAAGACPSAPAGHGQGLRAAVGPARAPEHQVVRRPGHDGPAERTCDDECGPELDDARSAAGAGRHLRDLRRRRGARLVEEALQHAGWRERRGARTQRAARPVEELPDRAVGDSQCRPDLLVGAALELTQDDRVALALGKVLDGANHLADPLALLERLRRLDHAVEVLRDLVVVPAVLAQEVQRRVVRHAVQPRLQGELGLVAADRPVGLEERLLDGVLRAAGREQALAVAQEGAPVAADDHLEGALVARAHEVHQPGVALRVQERTSGQAGGFDQLTRGHRQ